MLITGGYYFHQRKYSNLKSLELIQHQFFKLPKLFPNTSGSQLDESPQSNFHCRCVQISWLFKMKYLGQRMGEHIMIYTDTCNPCFRKGLHFDLKRSATHKHILRQSTTSLHYACFSHFSFTLVYTGALKRRVSLKPAITLMENMSG